MDLVYNSELNWGELRDGLQYVYMSAVENLSQN